MSPSKNMFGSAFEAPTSINESFPKNLKTLYSGPLLLSTIPFNRSCHPNIQAAANAFAADDAMGIGGWVIIQSSTFWFSETWTRQVFIPFLVVHKDLQRYTTSWEALAQLCCIILIVHQKCEPRPGLINIQPGSDNTGAEANINHGFSATEVLSEIIKLVSITQLRCNTLLNVHHFPGEKNMDADNLSRGRTSSFSHKWKISFNLSSIFDTTPFPRYMNTFPNVY